MGRDYHRVEQLTLRMQQDEREWWEQQAAARSTTVRKLILSVLRAWQAEQLKAKDSK